jgi:hypothetical protein
MNHGVSSWGDMPRLNLLLTIGSDLLTGEARSLPGSMADASQSPPYVGYAKTWLLACARAQRLLEANESSKLFEVEPLRVLIESPSQGGSWSELAENASAAATSAVFKGARWLAQAFAAANREGLPGMNYGARTAQSLAHAMESLMPTPKMAMIDVRHAGGQGALFTPEARLPSSGRILHPTEGLARCAPSWSQSELAQYIALHEFGHCAQHIHSKTSGAYYGWELLEDSTRTIFTNLGALDDLSKRSDLSKLVHIHFGECYADVFAALAAGAGDARASVAQGAKISDLRAAAIPSQLAQYSHGDYEHDTREALWELGHVLGYPDARAPMGAKEVHEMCLRCAQIGCLRWTAGLASQNAGPASSLFWTHMAQATRQSEFSSFFEENFSALTQRARQSSLLSPIADAIALASKSSRAGQGAAVMMLLDMEELGAAPRVGLPGSQPPEPAAKPLLGKLFSQRKKHTSVDSMAPLGAKPSSNTA